MKGVIPPKGAHVGKRYGALTVLSERSANWIRYLKCRCDCGKEVEKMWALIKKSRHPSCGCLQYELCGETNSLKQFDPSKYLHKRFGRLLVTGVEFRPDKGHGKNKLVCMCDCGAQAVVKPAYLSSSSTQSCGCLSKESQIANGEKSVDHGHAAYGVVDGLSPIYTCWLSIRALVAKGWRRGSHIACHEYDQRWEDFREFHKDFGDIGVHETIRRRDRTRPWSKENCYVSSGQRKKKYPGSITLSHTSGHLPSKRLLEPAREGQSV